MLFSLYVSNIVQPIDPHVNLSQFAKNPYTYKRETGASVCMFYVCDNHESHKKTQ